jgi:hypothetical protein
MQPPPQQSFSSGTSIPQPSFSGGTGIPQSSFSGGTGIPQPSFSGGTAMLKRKSHFLEESDFDSPVSFSSYFPLTEYRLGKVNKAQDVMSFFSSRILTMKTLKSFHL